MRQEIIRQFLREGVLLTPESLEKITEQNLESLLVQAREGKALIFSPKEEEASPEEIVVDVRKPQRKQKLTPQDFAKYYNTRFEGLREILAKKLGSAISASNAKKSGGPVATIGMVAELTPRGFTIEDTTGWAEVISKAEDIVPDDVIGVRGAVKEERIFAEEIAWPDVSMSHNHSNPPMKILLTETGEQTPETLVITPEAVSLSGKKHSLPNPGWITLSKDSQAATILVYSPGKPVTAKEAFTWLRKRHLFPSKEQIRGTDDPFLIEPIPNLLWIVQAEKFKESYKGVMIIASDGKEPIEVDLGTGEVKFEE